METEATTDPALSGNATHDNRILVIDDNEAIHRDFAKILEASDGEDIFDELDREFFGETDSPDEKRMDFELMFASQGRDGYELLKEEMAAGREFQVAFVDMRMPPGWNGTKTIEKLWEVDPNLRVVVCTAYSDQDWQEVTDYLGNSENLLVLKKPFDDIEVLQLAENLCKSWKQEENRELQLEVLENALQQQRLDLQMVHGDAEKLIQSIDHALVSLDSEGCVCRWNRAAETMFGLGGEVTFGQRFEELEIAWLEDVDLAPLFEAPSPDSKSQIELSFDRDGRPMTINAHICSVWHAGRHDGWLILASEATATWDASTGPDMATRINQELTGKVIGPLQSTNDKLHRISEWLEQLDDILFRLPELNDHNLDQASLEDLQECIERLGKNGIRASLPQVSTALGEAVRNVADIARIIITTGTSEDDTK